MSEHYMRYHLSHLLAFYERLYPLQFEIPHGSIKSTAYWALWVFCCRSKSATFGLMTIFAGRVQILDFIEYLPYAF
jgi:hypothetical protein